MKLKFLIKLVTWNYTMCKYVRTSFKPSKKIDYGHLQTKHTHVHEIEVVFSSIVNNFTYKMTLENGSLVVTRGFPIPNYKHVPNQRRLS